ncbi:MAG: hypothetical protein KDE51_01180 [Anaerolineales bacterium]|nr:hypothetical protein [Anaerolineales bacterium]
MELARDDKIASYLKLLHRHRGETKGAYDEVASIYDDFAKVWGVFNKRATRGHLINER